MEEENYCKWCDKVSNDGYYVDNFYFCNYLCQKNYFSEMRLIKSFLKSVDSESCNYKTLLEIDKKRDELNSLRFLDKGVN